MSKQFEAVKIQILDKEYLVTCSEEEHPELVASAKHLGAKMSEIRNSGKVVGTDRIAVMAGLNMAHEAIKSGYADTEHTRSTASRLESLNLQIEETLAKYRTNELN